MALSGAQRQAKYRATAKGKAKELEYRTSERGNFLEGHDQGQEQALLAQREGYEATQRRANAKRPSQSKKRPGADFYVVPEITKRLRRRQIRDDFVQYLLSLDLS